MKLNKSQRDAFVRAVMQDVPQVNFQDEVNAIIQSDNRANLPKEIAAIAKNPKLAPYLKVTTYSPGYGLSSVAVFTADSWSRYSPSAKAKGELDAIVAKSQAQSKARSDMEAKLRGVIESCSTLRQAKERLPEFEKYLPEEVEKSRQLPAIANLVADLTQMGWPKNKQPAATAA